MISILFCYYTKKDLKLKVIFHLLRPEDTVPGVSQSRDDVFVLVEMVVQGPDIQRNIRVFPLHLLHALRGGDDTEETDLFYALVGR